MVKNFIKCPACLMQGNMPNMSKKENEQSAVRQEARENFAQKSMEAHPVSSAEETIRILHVAETLAKIGDSLMKSSKFDFRAASPLPHQYVCARCELRDSFHKTARAKVLGRQLACIGDELIDDYKTWC